MNKLLSEVYANELLGTCGVDERISLLLKFIPERKIEFYFMHF